MSRSPRTLAGAMVCAAWMLAACGGQIASSERTCESATPITDANGSPTGFETCHGAVNRVEVVSADPVFPGGSCQGDEDEMMCDDASDCTVDGHGDCQHGEYWFSDYTWCACAYSCADDSECGADEACVSYHASDDLDWSQCVPAECRSGADCKSGECGLSEWEDECDHSNVVKLVCRTENDDCRSDDDCFTGRQCVAGTERWSCRPQDVCR